MLQPRLNVRHVETYELEVLFIRGSKAEESTIDGNKQETYILAGLAC